YEPRCSARRGELASARDPGSSSETASCRAQPPGGTTPRPPGPGETPGPPPEVRRPGSLSRESLRYQSLPAPHESLPLTVPFRRPGPLSRLWMVCRSNPGRIGPIGGASSHTTPIGEACVTAKPPGPLPRRLTPAPPTPPATPAPRPRRPDPRQPARHG